MSVTSCGQTAHEIRASGEEAALHGKKVQQKKRRAGIFVSCVLAALGRGMHRRGFKGGAVHPALFIKHSAKARSFIYASTQWCEADIKSATAGLMLRHQLVCSKGAAASAAALGSFQRNLGRAIGCAAACCAGGCSAARRGLLHTAVRWFNQQRVAPAQAPIFWSAAGKGCGRSMIKSVAKGNSLQANHTRQSKDPNAACAEVLLPWQRPSWPKPGGGVMASCAADCLT